MPYIFVDESGDLGFDNTKHKSSKNFIITFIFTNDKKTLDKIVKKTFAKLHKAEIKKHHGVLHAYKESNKTREIVLNLIKKSDDIKIMYIMLNKQKVYTRLRNQTQILYNYVTNTLLDRLLSKNLIPTDEIVYLIASQRETNKFYNNNFKKYLAQQNQIKIKVEIAYPNKERGLQVADMVSWAIFRALEHKEHKYQDIIKSKIVEGNMLYK